MSVTGRSGRFERWEGVGKSVRPPGAVRARFKSIYGAVVIGIAVTLFSMLWLQNQKIMVQSELRGYDTLYAIRGGQPVNLNIAVVGIDDQTLQNGASPTQTWPPERRYIAQAINVLHRDGARTIGIDLEYFGPSFFGAADDAALRRAIETARNVVLVNRFNTAAANMNVASETSLQEPWPSVGPSHAAGVGFANVAEDADSVIRWAPLAFPFPHEASVPSFPVAVAAASRHESARRLLRTLPADGIYISYVGDQRPTVASDLTFPRYSLIDVYQGYLPAKDFRNKIVLIVPYSIYAGDIHQTPVDQMYGGFIQANTLNTILQRNWLQAAGDFTNNLILLIIGALAAFIAARFGIGWSTLGTILLAVGFFVAAAVAFSELRTWIYFVTPEVTIVLVYALIMAFRFATEERLKRKLKGNFSQYLTQEIVDLFLSSRNPDRELAPASREISVLFVDVRGFTSMSERMKPEDVVTALDIYLEELTDAIEMNGGMINKYVGDEIIGVWNYLHIKPQPDHAMLAVRAGLDMVARMDGMNERLRAADLPAVKYGIGINSGPAVVGQMGTRLRKQYDIIGDTVNTGARLCSAAGGGEIIIGQATWELIGNRLIVEETEPLKLKGKSEPLQTFSCLGIRTDVDANLGVPVPASGPA